LQLLYRVLAIKIERRLLIELDFHGELRFDVKAPEGDLTGVAEIDGIPTRFLLWFESVSVNEN